MKRKRPYIPRNTSVAPKLRKPKPQRPSEEQEEIAANQSLIALAYIKAALMEIRVGYAWEWLNETYQKRWNNIEDAAKLLLMELERELGEEETDKIEDLAAEIRNAMNAAIEHTADGPKTITINP